MQSYTAIVFSKYERNDCKHPGKTCVLCVQQIHIFYVQKCSQTATSARLKRMFICVCTIASHPRFGVGCSERRKATLSAVNMMDDSWISLINDQENLEIVARATLKSRARMSVLETSATSNAATLCHSALLHIRSFAASLRLDLLL